VQTGATAFDHVYGVSRWEFNADHLEAERNFDEARAGVNSVVAGDILAAYDFSSGGTIASAAEMAPFWQQFSRPIRICEE
jgi:hypothetical protein